MLTHSIRDSLSVILTGIDNFSLITFSEKSRAAWNPYEMMFGWIPLLSRDYAAFKRDPAKTTTEVVPSPAYTSWAFDIYTNYT